MDSGEFVFLVITISAFVIFGLVLAYGSLVGSGRWSSNTTPPAS